MSIRIQNIEEKGGNGEGGKRRKGKTSSPLLRFAASPIHSRFIFIVGGARSGKSSFALKLAESIKGKRLYIATAETLDEEMKERIKKHKKDRGNNWNTIEEPIKIADVIKKNKKYGVILLDCLTLWISNLIHKEARVRGQGSGVIKSITELISACKEPKASIIIVSNEVGLGIVPDNPLARQFRDIAGFANQKIADAADEVYFMVSGIPLKIK